MTPFEQLAHALSLDAAAAGEGYPQRTRDHGIAVLLYHHARREGKLDRLPLEHLPALKRAVLLGQLRAQQMAQALETLLLAAKAEQIDLLVLKGAHLAAHVYEQPALRPMGDLDLLVRPGQWAAAETLLGKLGYRPDGHPDGYHAPFHDGVVRVELHRGLGAEGTRLAPPLEAIWENSEERRFGNAMGRVMSAEHLPLYLLFHIVKHAFHVPLRALWDLKLTGLERLSDEQVGLWNLQHARTIVLEMLEIFQGGAPVGRDAEVALGRVLRYQVDQAPDLEGHFREPLWRSARKLFYGIDGERPDFTATGISRRLAGAARYFRSRLGDRDLVRTQRDGYDLEQRLGLRSALPGFPTRLEAYTALLLVNLLLKTVGAVRLMAWLRAEQEPPRKSHADPASLVQAVSEAARRQPLPTLCLPQSLALCLMLRRRGMGGRVRFGARRLEGGAFQAHAWVSVEERSLDPHPEPGVSPFRESGAAPDLSAPRENR